MRTAKQLIPFYGLFQLRESDHNAWYAYQIVSSTALFLFILELSVDVIYSICR